jgi:hypothetical protein
MHGQSGPHGQAPMGFGLGVGHSLGFAHGMHDLNFGYGPHAGEVTFDAVIVGLSFNAVHSSPHIDTNTGGPGHFTANDGNLEGNGPSFDVPINSGRTNYGILVVGLGTCDWETMARRHLVKLGLAECFNLQPPNPLVSPARRYDTILPTNFRNPEKAVPDAVMPKGSYTGGTGNTTLWRTNWQVGERSLIDRMRGKAATRKNGVRTYLEVEVTSWFYEEAGDHELRLVVRALGGKDRGELMEHLKAASEFCKAMLVDLKAARPSSDAQAWRARAATV